MEGPLSQDASVHRAVAGWPIHAGEAGERIKMRRVGGCVDDGWMMDGGETVVDFSPSSVDGGPL